jgi:xanthine dehydrogenase molybdopterin-binding subunit B
VLASDNAYKIDQFVAKGNVYFTNKATGTAFRSFGVIQANQIVEHAIEKMCEAHNLNSFEVRRTNFYPSTPNLQHPFTTPYGQKVLSCNLEKVWNEIDEKMKAYALSFNSKTPHATSGYDQLRARLDELNSGSSVRKHGISVLPLKYPVSFNNISKEYARTRFYIDPKTFVVTIQTGGVEMGQGTTCHSCFPYF